MLVEVDNDAAGAAGAHPPPAGGVVSFSLSRSLSIRVDGAARHGDFALVSRLLQAARAAGMLLDGIRGSLFMSAAFGGNANIVRALAQAGRGGGGNGSGGGDDTVIADINKPDLSTGQRPLHVATRLGHRSAVRALLFYGADVNAPVQPLPSSKVSWPKTLLGGMTALHWASLRGYSEIVEDLIMIGGDLNARVSHSGETPLHLAARHGQAAAVGVLLDAGAAASVFSRHNLSPMDLAASSNDSSTLIEFLHRGMDPNARNALGYTAVHQAAYNNASDALRLLLESGGSASSATDVGHYTPLHVAAAFSTRSSATAAPAPAAGFICPTNNNNNKDTAAAARHAPAAASAVRTIVRYGGGADVLRVDALDAEGSTPLHTACVNLQDEAVRDLLDVGANEKLFTLSIGDFVKTTPDNYGAGGASAAGGGGGDDTCDRTQGRPVHDGRRRDGGWWSCSGGRRGAGVGGGGQYRDGAGGRGCLQEDRALPVTAVRQRRRRRSWSGTVVHGLARYRHGTLPTWQPTCCCCCFYRCTSTNFFR
ncbi:ankyrin repeat protein [Ectocarpus siliculosus]|uniref:Ankyrin repeat protein n=1 Tax=Ectocarpus siliculosus TaxID=2880 RepID=D8LDL7_ECTSI|nr:ankyrin repeat protein [Ectocarpus siliculosus]|eukprot:CBN74092.1 ankyrin repeat protein [Ectocarpus siliculosus]